MLAEFVHILNGYLTDVASRLDWWAALGFAAQVLFGSRFLVQWLASERAGKSTVPIAFWFLSLGGGILLFTYALSRRDPVFIAGQGFGLLVYLRNLHFIFRERRGPALQTR
jgi:lipid-A-disaccharide synthase-like uncharacterized protein